jgi:hypothetical protein
MVAIMAQKKLFHMVLFGNCVLISSKANNTPPMGDPKATATPAALDAVKISLISALLVLNRLKHLEMTLPTQHAMCTEGPSLPIDKLEATAIVLSLLTSP